MQNVLNLQKSSAILNCHGGSIPMGCRRMMSELTSELLSVAHFLAPVAR